MRSVVLVATVSLDGILAEEGSKLREFAQSIGDSPDDTRAQFVLSALERAGALAMGRVRYERLARSFQEEGGPARDPEADLLDRLPKAVFSRTLPSAAWGPATIHRGDAAEEIAALRRQGSGDILVNGGARLMQSLAGADLVDEYRLMLHPFVAGGGRRCFTDGAGPFPLVLEAMTRLGGGVTGAVYRRAR